MAALEPGAMQEVKESCDQLRRGNVHPRQARSGCFRQRAGSSKHHLGKWPSAYLSSSSSLYRTNQVPSGSVEDSDIECPVLAVRSRSVCAPTAIRGSRTSEDASQSDPSMPSPEQTVVPFRCAWRTAGAPNARHSMYEPSQSLRQNRPAVPDRSDTCRRRTADPRRDSRPRQDSHRQEEQVLRPSQQPPHVRSKRSHATGTTGNRYRLNGSGARRQRAHQNPSPVVCVSTTVLVVSDLGKRRGRRRRRRSPRDP
jgi:hypothetical protein